MTGDILHLFAFVSWLLLLIVGLTAAHFWKHGGRRTLFALFLFASPLWVYATSSFSDTWVGCFLALCCLVAMHTNRPILLFVLALFAGLGKEPNPILLLALGGGLIWVKGWKQHKLTIGIPLLLASILSAGGHLWLNYVRYDSFSHLIRMQPFNYAPTMSYRLSFWMGAWFSPGGGVVLFWPLLPLCLLLLFRRLWKEDRWKILLQPTILLLVFLVGITFGLASWKAPFGWIAWGNRLLLPWMMVYIVLLLSNKGNELVSSIQSWKPWKHHVLGITLGLLTIPHMLVLHSPRLITTTVPRGTQCSQSEAQRTKTLKRLTLDNIESHRPPPGYFACRHKLMWHPLSALWQAYRLTHWDHWLRLKALLIILMMWAGVQTVAQTKTQNNQP
jgi:hypothetical protein